MRRDRAEEPAERHANGGHAPDRAAGVAQLLEIQVQPAFEQYQCHPDSDHRFEQVAEGMLGIENAQHRPGEEARGQHQDDGRPIGAPG